MFRCKKCLVEKSTERFPKAPTKRGHKLTCRECYAARMREYYKNNPEKYQRHKLYVKVNDSEYKRKAYLRHGLSDDDFNRLRARYDGKCWACKEEEAICVDHDHSCCKKWSCGKCVRGILCPWCNTSLGHAKDSINRLEGMIEYLRSGPNGLTEALL